MATNAISSAPRVLLVEDSVSNQLLMKQLLKKQGCEVTIASNGEEGVQIFADQTFDVVLMDVQMPVMDGLTATRIIRHHETGSGKRVLIVAVTAGFDRETCIAAGMDDHFRKPVHANDIRSLIDQLSGIESK